MAQQPAVAFCSNSTYSIVFFRLYAIKRLIGLGYRVVVVAPPDGTVEKLKNVGAIHLPWTLSGHSLNPRQELQSIVALYRILKVLKPELAFFYTIKPATYGSVVAKLLNIRSIAVLTGLGYAFNRHSFAAIIARLAARSATKLSDETWFLNIDDQSTYNRGHKAKQRAQLVIPGEGIDPQWYSPVLKVASNEVAFTFLYLGRTIADKGIREYVEVARLAKGAVPNCRFIIVGPTESDTPTAIPADEIQSWRQEELVEFFPQVDDVRSVIAECDCLVLPSYREGLPRVLLEAGSMERMAIATDVPGCRDVVRHGMTGLLCEPRSVASLLSAMMEAVALTREERETMGKNARQLVIRQFSDGIVFGHYVRAVEEYCQKPDFS